MILRFKGSKVEQNNGVGGCSSCGKSKAKSGMKLETIKRYYTPSGSSIVFRVGRLEEVSEEDGEFLLEQYYIDLDGKVVYPFERV